MNFKNYWYIVAQSKELKKDQVIHKTLMNEWLALYRDENGKAVAIQDRCIHRNYQLSRGRVKDGKIQCSYHGWVFDGEGKLTHIPSEGEPGKKVGNRCAKKYHVQEIDDLIFVCLDYKEELGLTPFRMPSYKQKGFETVRLFNVFKNNVLNCAENYVDVPHTVFVHDGIFRTQMNQKIQAEVSRVDGAVHVDYFGENSNLGWFSWFLNPTGAPITHRDSFYAPNITSVHYTFGDKEFWITSQCIPINDELTYVYTDLTYKFGFLGKLAKPIVHFQGQSVINQDIEALNNQMEVIKKYGMDFSNSTADVIHVMIESLREEVEKEKDPRELPIRNLKIEFWI
jgi:phenylpropionate dioxygenase-like ring-hydroxylating dioxygenase large terminal subunit